MHERKMPKVGFIYKIINHLYNTNICGNKQQ